LIFFFLIKKQRLNDFQRIFLHGKCRKRKKHKSHNKKISKKKARQTLTP